MANSFKQLRRTAVKAVADPETFKAGISQQLHNFSLRRQAPALSDPGIGDPKSIEPDKVVDHFALEDEISQKKSDMPLRLICTDDGDGKLYSQQEVEERFKAENPSFFDGSAQSDTEKMRETVEASFKFAMFSHRWEGVEPLFKDLHGSDVFSLAESPGTRKLQQFCRHARKLGFTWAWSDTVCIDKASTSELQKSIISMFKWYRNSDVTIVYLGDVHEDSFEALMGSIWFLRGWTLQELIAPRRLVFFKSDWTPLAASWTPLDASWTPLAASIDIPVDNYKESPTFRKLISEITGIDDDALTKFDPTSRDVTIRQRMSWAARRKTTEIEDIAYSLMGIFNVHLPVMYGEGESAFMRLQVEIMAESDDSTLFDWRGKPGPNSFLASSPACFDPFTPPIINPVPLTLMVSNALNKVPVVQRTQKGIDKLTVGVLNMGERLSINAQHPANFMAGAKIHCHGLEYTVIDVEETAAMTEARKTGKELFQYHIIAESLHPVTVTLAEPINTGFGCGRLKSKYLSIFRVWDQSLATGKSMGKPMVENGEENDHTLRRTFRAHLLKAEAGGIYRRILVKDLIAAKLDQVVEVRLLLQVRTIMIK